MSPTSPSAIGPLASDASPTGPYRLKCPTIADAHAAMTRLYGAQVDGIWAGVLAQASLRGSETGLADVKRLIAAMIAADPVTALCGRSLAIRLSAFEHLSIARTVIQDAL
ncbi:MAG TPA: hypothetical protein VFG35_31895 [Actinoplanes sp.]|nr:hypothetical protein [Actinoplanes sp.]